MSSAAVLVPARIGKFKKVKKKVVTRVEPGTLGYGDRHATTKLPRQHHVNHVCKPATSTSTAIITSIGSGYWY